MRPPAEVDNDAVRRVRTLARILDEAVRIPGTGIRVGLDALLGLLPVGGDLAGALLSGSAILIAARAGAPTTVLTRMVINVAIDAIVGSVPVLGDLFDVGWRANSKNAQLLESWMGQPEATTRASKGVVAAILIALLLLVAGGVAVSVLLFKALLGLLT